MGFGVSSIAMTKPTLPSPTCIDASVSTEPSVRITLPVPALKTGSSSRITHASTAASRAVPPEVRILAAFCTAISRFF